MSLKRDAFFKLGGRTLQMPLCESPFLEEIISAGNYSQSEAMLLRKFSADGYLVFDLEMPDFAGFAATLIGEVAQNCSAAEGQPARVQDAWYSCPHVKKLACLPQILDKVELLYGTRPFPFQTLNFRIGSTQMAHSDAVHFNSIPARMMCGVWIALEDTDENNGPFHYYPGSQKLPVYTFEDMGVRTTNKPQDYDLYFAVYEPFVQRLIASNRLTKKQLTAKRGQALIWAANLLHGGEAINDPVRTRYSQVTHYYFKNCVYYTPMWSDVGLRSIYYRSPHNLLSDSTECPRFDGQLVRLDEMGEEALEQNTISMAAAADYSAVADISQDMQIETIDGMPLSELVGGGIR